MEMKSKFHIESEENNMEKIVGYFMESGIWYQGKEQPPQKTPLIMIGDKPSFNLDNYSDEDDISVLSVEGNWYTIKKKELILE